MPYPTPTGPAGQVPGGPADQQALNELKYKRYLEQLAGFAPGESDLPDDELMRREALAQAMMMQQAQGGNPGQMQGQVPGQFPGQVPNRFQGQAQGMNPSQVQGMHQPGASYPAATSGRQSMTNVPFQAIMGQIHSRPGMFEHLEGIDLDGDGRPDVMPSMGPPPANPAARMQWQTMMAQRQAMAQAANVKSAQRKAMNNAFMLQTLQRSDPMFPKVSGWIESFYEALPAKIQRGLQASMQATPGAYLELYSHMRDHLIGEIRRIQYGNSPVPNISMPRPGDADPRARIRQAVAGRMDPIVLESAGALDDRLPAASRSAELAALKKRVKSGGAREGDLLRYIELSMD